MPCTPRLLSVFDAVLRCRQPQLRVCPLSKSPHGTWTISVQSHKHNHTSLPCLRPVTLMAVNRPKRRSAMSFILCENFIIHSSLRTTKPMPDGCGGKASYSLRFLIASASLAARIVSKYSWALMPAGCCGVPPPHPSAQVRLPRSLGRTRHLSRRVYRGASSACASKRDFGSGPPERVRVSLVRRDRRRRGIRFHPLFTLATDSLESGE